ncbi:MAG: DUF3810 domain-containing protein [Prevotellaceae bacterium]|jgi:hypothetical protein|nr:DUF3810 domain-containing protein [Prevotellaceae bacterium]
MKYFDCIFVLILSLIFFSRPEVAEWYGRAIYPSIAVGLSAISGQFFFSLYDIFISFLIILIPASIILAVFRILSVRKILSILFFVIFVTVSWFYFSWGINYFRPDVYHRTGLKQAQFDSIKFSSFLDSYIDDINAARVEVDAIYLDKVDVEIESLYSRMSERLAIRYPCGKRRTKRMIYESFITKIGVSGYFGPFFNEVHVNFYPLSLDIPYTLAHEKAHQFGVASESECNFYAFVVCTAGSSPEVRYSGYIGAFGHVFSYARRLLSADEFASRLARLDQGVLEDYRASYHHWQRGINEELSQAQSKLYDAYLKTNQIKSGVANYSEMLGLLVSWYEGGK